MPYFDIPVLFLTYNRLEKTKKSFERIREVKPEKLYFFSDGPKDLKDANKVRSIRKYLEENINWKCYFNKKYNSKNFGCRKGVSTAIDWFFESVKFGIIIEDDCVPDISFFNYSRQLLIKYADDNRIMHISGSNNGLLTINNEDYYFSKYALIWGWATWKRSWEKYDLELNTLPKNISKVLFSKTFGSLHQKFYWLNAFISMYFNKHDTWDLSWFYTCAINGYSIIPNKNMVENIGFDQEATHTKSMDNSILHNSSTLRLSNFPEQVIHLKANDKKLFKTFFKPRSIFFEGTKFLLNLLKLIKKQVL